ncbi:MAG TPA: cbb3-type cytochrome c oxidase N-terminal domain-containing protein [Chitinophagaceae bacterium]|nr:cbb3-type cytochrome c oxidase N-terminal domain-containing protein [Chitinophagaceae bacterium]
MRRPIIYKLIFPGLFLSLTALLPVAAQEVPGNSTTTAPVASTENSWLFWGIAIGFVLILLLMLFVLSTMNGLGESEEGAHVTSLRQWWSNLDKKIFTKAVPVQQEADVLLDHDYDGIKELDNALPPWWKWGFYITLVIGVFYLLRFHVWKTGPTPEQEYNSEMVAAAKQMEAYRKKSNDLVDETTVTMADATGIAAGKQLFQQNCIACHGSAGEGGVGPNLTDNYWLHGGRINDVFKTIKYGYPDKGMQSWEKMFSPSQIRNLASFVKSLYGTNPPNPKAPQGDLYNEGQPVDSTATQSSSKDSLTTKK